MPVMAGEMFSWARAIAIWGITKHFWDRDPDGDCCGHRDGFGQKLDRDYSWRISTQGLPILKLARSFIRMKGLRLYCPKDHHNSRTDVYEVTSSSRSVKVM